MIKKNIHIKAENDKAGVINLRDLVLNVAVYPLVVQLLTEMPAHACRTVRTINEPAHKMLVHIT